MAKRKGAVLGYRFLAQDPALDLFREAKRRSGKSFEEISEASGVTSGTLRKWEYGDVRKPQHITLRFAMEACGFEEVFVNAAGERLSANYEKPRRKKS